jgi:gamma-glutamyltranspeptidase/glutathione hydrolase
VRRALPGVRPVEDDEQREVLVGREPVVGAGGDEERASLLEGCLDALDVEHAAALEHDVDLVELVGLLSIGLGRDEYVDPDLEAGRRVDDLVTATTLGERLSRLVHVEGVHRPEPTACDARGVQPDLDALFRPGAALTSGWRRMPAVAGDAMLATSHPLATQAGLRAFAAGGNAVDAALAAAAVLTVAEPTDNGPGGDAFALVWQDGKLHGLNGSGRSPAVLGGVPHDSHGPRSVTVPGAVRAWADLAERFGRLGLDAALASAADLADRGLPCSARIAHKWARAGGHAPMSAPAVGERFRLPELGATLRRIASQGPAAFYEGEVAAAIASASWLAEDDLASHRSEWVEPLRLEYRGVEVCELPPNGQGAAALIALGLYDGLEPTLHSRIEAMKLAFADVYAHVHDGPLPARLLDDEHLAERRALVRSDAAIAAPASTLPKGGTTYLCAVDGEGTAISLIQSVYDTFGSGVVARGTGVVLQNRAAGFSDRVDHPNRLAPATRPFHTIIPGMLLECGELLGPFGVMGGAMQPQGHFQVVLRLVDERMDPQAALDAPRWRVEEDGAVQLEPGLWPEEERLRALGHAVARGDVQHGFGVGQIILRHGDVWLAGSDGRGDGFAAGFDR